MRQSIQHSEPVPSPEPSPRARTVTGNRFPPKCACGCGFAIPRDLAVRLLPDPLGFGRDRNRHHPEWFGLL